MAKTILGVDNGNSDIKSYSTSTPSGFFKSTKKPFVTEGYLLIDDIYYIPSTERFPYQKDKTTNNNAFILTLFAIAKELIYRAERKNAKKVLRATKNPELKNKVIGVQGEILKFNNIELGVGVPPTHHAVLQKATVDYYMSRLSNGVNFEYDGYQFNFKVSNCVCLPQALAAIIGYSDNPTITVTNYKAYYVVDIGGETVDFLTFSDSVILSQKCDSKPFGILVMCETIRRDIEINTGKRINNDIIENVLRGQAVIISDEIKELIRNMAREWLHKIIGVLEQFGADFSSYPVLFLGGGSLLLKEFIEELNLPKVEFIDDPHANAIGYEKILLSSSTKN